MEPFYCAIISVFIGLFVMTHGMCRYIIDGFLMHSVPEIIFLHTPSCDMTNTEILAVSQFCVSSFLKGNKWVISKEEVDL